MSRAWLFPALILLCLHSGWSLALAEENAPADDNTPAALMAGHSMYGEAFNEGPRQKAYLMGGTGKVHLQVTTKDPAAQKFFDQGVGQLHGFWWFEAERSFRQAADLDPDCAMAYWGMAMANFSNQSRSKGFIEKAVALKDKVSRREKLYIEGLAKYAEGKTKDNKQRRGDFIRSLEDILLEFPDELEAKAFLIWAQWDSNGTVPIVSHEALDALIGDVLAVEPMHPVHHYRIHLWDGRKPARALASSALCGQGAPSIAHMWHMPGHIYWKLNRYADSAWQQEASARVDHAHMVRDRVMPYKIHNYAHNNEWLTRSLSHVGRAHDAVDLAKNMIELPRHPQKNQLKSRGSGAYYGRTRLLEVLQRYELWDELIALSETMYLEPTDSPDDQLKRLRALGVAWFSKQDVERGKQQIAAIEQMRDKIKADQMAAVEKAEAKAREAKESDEKIAKAKKDAEKEHSSKLSQIETALADLNGHLALAAGDAKAALEHFGKVKDLSKEAQSRIQLQAGEKDKAEQLARQAVDSGKNQIHPLLNQAEVLHRLGKTKEAGEAFKRAREMSASLDMDLPIVKRLAPLAKELGWEENWRVAASVPADTGKRPELDALGPFRWHPSPAPTWELADSAGQTVGLKQYEGRPIVLLFYLGHGCLHCVEQLKKFAPLAEQYQQAGISLLAVSSETAEDLNQSLQGFSESGEFPITLVSDPSLEVFKAYRAHDDFEGRPLHGAFLVDGSGLIRWQDIGHEPFTDAEFLLNESKRLLSQPAP